MWWSCVKNIIKINFVCGYVHVCFCPLLCVMELCLKKKNCVCGYVHVCFCPLLCVVRLCFKKEMCVWLCACVFLPFVVCGGVVYFKFFCVCGYVYLYFCPLFCVVG